MNNRTMNRTKQQLDKAVLNLRDALKNGTIRCPIDISIILDTLTALEKQNMVLETLCAKQNKVLEDFVYFTNNSTGIAGWHLNGDVEPWNRMEVVQEAQAALALTPQQLMDKIAQLQQKLADMAADREIGKEEIAAYCNRAEAADAKFAEITITRRKTR